MVEEYVGNDAIPVLYFLQTEGGYCDAFQLPSDDDRDEANESDDNYAVLLLQCYRLNLRLSFLFCLG
jgi:hypothetical protein